MCATEKIKGFVKLKDSKHKSYFLPSNKQLANNGDIFNNMFYM